MKQNLILIGIIFISLFSITAVGGDGGLPSCQKTFQENDQNLQSESAETTLLKIHNFWKKKRLEI